MTILLIAEHDNQSLSEQTAKTLSAALKIGSDVHVLVAGKGAKAAAVAASNLKGVSKVLIADADELEQRLAEPLAALIVSLAGGYDTIIAPATTGGKNVMPRVAALLDVMQVSEIIEVISPDTFKRPIYAGNALQTVQSTRRQEGDHGAHRLLPGGARRRHGAGRDGRGGRQPRPVDLRREQAFGERPPRADLGQDHHLRRPRAGLGGEIPGGHPAGRRQARRRGRRLAAPRSTPAMRRTTGRSARPARWWRPTSTSRSASPAPSSIWPA